MANQNLKNMLALSKKIEEKGASASKGQTPRPKRIMTEKQLDEQIDLWDNEVFGKSKPTEGYDPEIEMQQIKERRNRTPQRELSNPILREVFDNPYELEIDDITGETDPRRMEFDNILKDKYGKLNEAIKINETIEKKEKEKLIERKQTTNNGTYINSENITEIIENIIDRKLNEFKDIMVNENTQKTPNKVSMIMLDDNFTFIDNEGRMYKCTGLKYVGKAKIK